MNTQLLRWVAFVGGMLAVSPAIAQSEWNCDYEWKTGPFSTPGVEVLVRDLSTYPNGDLFASGTFRFTQGGPTYQYARWNGSNWSPVSGFTNVRPLQIRPNETFFSYSYDFNSQQCQGEGCFSIFSGDGTNWTQLGGAFTDGPFQTYLHCSQIMPNGDLIVGGNFLSIGGVQIGWLARWNGTAWSPMFTTATGDPFFPIVSMALDVNGDLLVGGYLQSINGVSTRGIARWNGTTWSGFGEGLNYTVYAIAVADNGDIYAGGAFTASGSQQMLRIARWSGDGWHQIGGGMAGPPNHLPWVENILILENSVIASGNFTTAGGQPIPYLARWNGLEWSSLDGGLMQDGAPYPSAVSLVRDTSDANCNGFIVAGGFDHAGSGMLAVPGIAVWGTTIPNCGACDSVDFNNDTSIFDPLDIDAFLSVYSEGPCIPAAATCNEIDFNNDGSIFDPCDIESFLRLWSEGPCLHC